METLSLTESPLPTTAARLAAAPVMARRAVATLFLVNGALFATWVSRLPAIESSRGLSHAMLGVYLFVMAFGAMIAMPMAGLLGSRIGSAQVCRVSALIFAGMLPLLALAPNATTFALALFAFGIGHGALDVSMNAQAVAVEKLYRPPIMASFHALFSTGGLIGAALGGGIAALGLTPAVHFIVMAILLGAVALTTFRALLPFEMPSASKKAALFPLPTRGLLALGVIALCIMVGEGAMADWSAIYLKKIIATSEGIAAVGYAAFSIAMALGRFFGDSLSARFGPVRLLRGSACVAMAGLVLILASPFSPLALLGFACVGIGFAPIIPLVFSAAGHRSGINPGVALASVTTLGYLGFLLGPPIIGFAAGLVGLRVALGLLFASTLTAVILAPNVGSAQAD
jgi:MFS family permease